MTSLEKEYREGKKSLRNIADEFGISEAVIRKYAKKNEWVRDLSAKIKAKADEIVRNASVRNSVRINEIEVIKSAAELQAGAILQESDEIKRLSRIAESFEFEIEKMTSEEDLEKRTKILKSLTEIREKIINLRRRNLRINDNSLGAADSPVESIADIIRAATGNVLRPHE